MDDYSVLQQSLDNPFPYSSIQEIVDNIGKTYSYQTWPHDGTQIPTWWNTHKNMPDEYEALEQKYNKALSESKRDKKKMAKTRTLIRKELRKKDSNYPFAIDPKDQFLESLLDSL